MIELFKEMEGSEPTAFGDDEDDGINIVEEVDDVKPWEMLDEDSRRRRLRKLKRSLQEGAAVADNPDLSTELDPSVSAYISNPVVCKTLGSAMIWERLNKDKYPVYVKDSLLNTNADFDFGEFQ